MIQFFYLVTDLKTQDGIYRNAKMQNIAKLADNSKP